MGSHERNRPLPAFWPECVYRRAWAVPLTLNSESIQRLKRAGVNTVWTVATRSSDVSAWKSAGLDVQAAVDLSAADPALAVAERWIGKAAALCRRLGVEPRALYEQHLDALRQLLADPSADRP